MPKLEAYHRSLPYGYAPGIYPSHALLDARPAAAARLLVHSFTEGGEGIAALCDRCAALGIRAEEAPHALGRISHKENCYAAIVFDKYIDALATDAPQVVLVSPSDMGNLGTILRTCLGFGLRDLAVIRPAADVFDPRVVRASMGALFAMRVAVYEDFDAYREAYPAHALYPFMLEASMPLQEAAAACDRRYALVFGNEATGLPASYAALGQAVRIAHTDAIDSLNLAVAVAIGAYAFTQNNRFQEGS